MYGGWGGVKVKYKDIRELKIDDTASLTTHCQHKGCTKSGLILSDNIYCFEHTKLISSGSLL